jgi:hypothetical protein
MPEGVRERRRERVDRVGGEADDRHDREQHEQPGVSLKELHALLQRAPLRGDARVRPRPDDEDAEDEREVRGCVDPECRRDAKSLDRHRSERGTGRAGEIPRHRVERYRRGYLLPVDERRQ